MNAQTGSGELSLAERVQTVPSIIDIANETVTAMAIVTVVITVTVTALISVIVTILLCLRW